MTTELARPETSRLAQVTGFSDQQISLIAQTVAPGATRLELAWFLYNASRLELEPTLDQIYLIKYKRDQVGEIVIGINGYRAMAESSGCYAGSDDAVFEYDSQGKLSKATVTVWKIVQGMRVPFSASARWDEFYPGDGTIGEQYRKRPHNQLGIRAESHALRKAFPYQTRKLETRAEVPTEWRAAAEADIAAQHDPALVAHNARKYDQVFSTEAREQSARTRETTQAHVVSASPAEGDPDVDVELELNQRLQADAFDIGASVVKALKADRSWPLDRIKGANAELQERITSRLDEAEAVAQGQVELPA